ncbi:MAG: family 43 glycosylhydrolase [Opitutaceae bacterium]
MIIRILPFLVFATLVPSAVADTSAVFRYQNPISEGLDPKGVRDCQVFRDGERWYLTATAWPHWPRQEAWGILNPGVVLYSSDDLLSWKFEKVILPHGGPDKWYHRRFWAPEIHRLKGRYYALFNASNPDNGFPGQHTGFAVADRLMGPYTVVTGDAPLGNGNDLTFFEDDDGSVWAFWNRGREFGIGFAQVDLETGTFLTEPQSAITPAPIEYELDADGNPLMEPGYDGRPRPVIRRCFAWDSIGIEGAYVIRRGGTYILFYSSWTRGYEIGTATAPAITGPWTKSPGNPFYGEQNEQACLKNGLPYTGRPDSPFNQVGHNEIFTGPDGNLWLSCHGILKTRPEQPMLVIDPLEFDGDGQLVRKAPTHTPQVVALP